MVCIFIFHCVTVQAENTLLDKVLPYANTLITILILLQFKTGIVKYTV